MDGLLLQDEEGRHYAPMYVQDDDMINTRKIFEDVYKLGEWGDIPMTIIWFIYQFLITKLMYSTFFCPFFCLFF